MNLTKNNISKLLVRTCVLIIPFIVMCCIWFISLLSTTARSAMTWVFDLDSYWTPANEWDQVSEDLIYWYRFWLTGKGRR